MRPNERLAAANLDQFLSAYMEGEATPPPDNVDPSDTACAAELATLAANIQPDPEFARNLEAQLLSAAVAGYTQPSIETPTVDVGQRGIRPWWKQPLRQWITGGARTQPVRRSSQVRLIQVVLAIILALVVLPVLGQTILRYFVPQEVDTLPESGNITRILPQKTDISLTATVVHTTTSTIPDSVIIEGLEQQTGLSLLAPTYLPDECVPQNTFTYSDIQSVILQYSCVIIEQERVTEAQQPYVTTGSVEDIEINSKPAKYIRGTWINMNGERTYNPDVGSQIILEKDNMLIKLRATGTLTKDEHIKIAESMIE